MNRGQKEYRISVCHSNPIVAVDLQTFAEEAEGRDSLLVVERLMQKPDVVVGPGLAQALGGGLVMRLWPHDEVESDCYGQEKGNIAE